MVELYLSTEVSYQELALSVNMNNYPLITKWVNDFRIAGPDALRPKKKGQKKSMSLTNVKKDSSLSPEESTTNTSAEHVKQLKDENLRLRIEEVAFRGRSMSERTARVIHSLRREFKLKDILSYTGFPKATYMYWKKRFDRKNPDIELENMIIEIRKNNKDFGYRRIYGELRKRGMIVNKKKVQRIIQKLGLQVTSFTRKSRKYSSYRCRIGRIAPNRMHRCFKTKI